MVEIWWASFNVTTPIDEDIRIVTCERKTSTKEIEYLDVLAIMDLIGFYMKLGRITWWPLALIIIKILNCLGLSCVLVTKTNNANM